MKWLPPPLSHEERMEVHQAISSVSVPRRSFFILVVLSTTIASYGLLANSTAVVIGAMLVAPLMGPIFGIALAACRENRRLLALASLAEVLGVVLAIAIGLCIGWMPLRPEFGSEILGRTQPTLLDVLVALASGLAGAYAFVNPKLNPALAGVAIATALVPPLATCGLCLAAGEWRLASGAFLLFLANFLAIEIAAAAVFSLSGLAADVPGDLRGLGHVTKRFRWSLLLLCGVGAFMTRTLAAVVESRRLNAQIQASLSNEVGAITGAHLTAVHLTSRDGAVRVVADVLTPQAFDPEEVARLEDGLQRKVRPRLHLVIRSLLSRDADRNGPVFLSESDLERRAREEAQATFLQRAAEGIRQALQGTPGALLADIRREAAEPGPPTVTAVIRTPTAIDPSRVQAIQERLVRSLGQEVRLVVRSVLTRDADAEHFLYEPEATPSRLSEADARLRARLEGALARLLASAVPGAGLSELEIGRTGGRLELVATTRTPRNFEPPQVRRVEAALRRYVDPRIDLIVRSVVGTDTTSGGYRVVRPGLPAALGGQDVR